MTVVREGTREVEWKRYDDVSARSELLKQKRSD